jgi:hypothetical protein
MEPYILLALLLAGPVEVEPLHASGFKQPANDADER